MLVAMLDDMALIEQISFGLALLGAALGVMNTCHALWKDRVRLRVRARRWVGTDGENSWCVEITNLSPFELTLTEVSIDMGNKEKFFAAVLMRHLPKRLKPRAAFTAALTSATEKHRRFPLRGRFRAVTACGYIARTGWLRFKESDNLTPAAEDEPGIPESLE